MRSSEHVVDNFPSKRDGWLVSLLGMTAAIEVIATVALMTIGPPLFWLRGFIPLILIVSAILIVWSLFGTSYRVLGADLVIRSGPFRWRVPIASIASVTPSRSAIATPALSTNRLDLRCTGPERHVLVSPEEPAAFIGALKRVKPTITVVGEQPFGDHDHA